MMQQAHARAVDTARSVSEITVNFFRTLDLHAANLSQIMEEAHTVNNQKLSEFEKKFEVGSPSLQMHDMTLKAYELRLPTQTDTVTCRNALPTKKKNCWKRWQSCLQVQI